MLFPGSWLFSGSLLPSRVSCFNHLRKPPPLPLVPLPSPSDTWKWWSHPFLLRWKYSCIHFMVRADKAKIGQRLPGSELMKDWMNLRLLQLFFSCTPVEFRTPWDAFSWTVNYVMKCTAQKKTSCPLIVIETDIWVFKCSLCRVHTTGCRNKFSSKVRVPCPCLFFSCVRNIQQWAMLELIFSSTVLLWQRTSLYFGWGDYYTCALTLNCLGL